MLYILNCRHVDEIAAYLYARDHKDVPVETLNHDWLMNSVGEHIGSLFTFNPSDVPEEEEAGDFFHRLVLEEPDEYLTEMLLGGVDGLIRDIEVSASPYRIARVDSHPVAFPCIFVDLYGEFRPC